MKSPLTYNTIFTKFFIHSYRRHFILCLLCHLLYLFVQDEEKKEFGMRRSASERKLTKKKKDERKDKSRKAIKL